MRKILSFLISVCIVLTLFSGITVSAYSVTESEEMLFGRMKTAVQNFDTQVNLSDLNLGEEPEIAIKKILSKITGIPEFYYVVNGYVPITNGIELIYQYDKQEVAEKNKEISEVAESIVSDLHTNELSDVYKALLIHDRLAVLCEYDYENYKEENIPFDSYNMYGALIKKIAVCEGYSKAYRYLLGLVGIESELCVSNQINHMWNIVEIDGKKYHVDVTHDDPVDDIIGRVSHNNFLVSSKGLQNDANDYDMTLENTEYEDYYWRNSETEILYTHGDIYYFDSVTKELKRLSDNHVIDTINARWSAGEGMVWTGNYTRISACDENIYYSDNNKIYIYHTKTGFKHEVLTPHLPDHLEMFGFTHTTDEHGGKFLVEYRNTPNETKKVDGQEVFAEVEEKEIYFEISEHKFTGLVSGDDEKWHYVVDAKPQFETGLVKIGKTTYYIEEGIRGNITGFVKNSDGEYCYLKESVFQDDNTGFFNINGEWHYLINGVWQNGYSGLAKHTNGMYYYATNGIIDYSVTGFVKHSDGKTYYVSGGVVPNTYTGFIPTQENKYLYVENGILQTKTGIFKHTDGKYYYTYNGELKFSSGFIQYNGKAHYCIDGVWQKDFTGLMDHSNGNSYYVQNGCRNNNTTGFIQRDGKAHYVLKGVWQKNFTGLVKHSNGNSYYVANGCRNNNTSGFIQQDGKAHYVLNGVWQKNYTGLVKHSNGNLYYVQNGCRNNTTGFIQKDGKAHYVLNGVWQKNFTGFFHHSNGNYYYVQNGCRNNVTGTVKVGGKTYTVKNGVRV